ncbi:Rmf/CrpP family protein [Sphingomonas lenta]|uniref:Uncharacterized protein n=1 Tax=Sphingomonas lenta TaxID=1141887 RepID=A0A2A2SBH7_9SPHN|nr:Rmf/CrpP family protein [Sphingomonas lenta]PAX06606.1 hypothetical protein CKY28_15765 [Sphingomonas lenta]
MAEQQQSPAFQEGAEAGRDIDHQAGDCPYDHDPETGELQRRQDWLAGFASTRGQAGSAEEARDYHPLEPKAQIDPDLPVYINS